MSKRNQHRLRLYLKLLLPSKRITGLSFLVSLFLTILIFNSQTIYIKFNNFFQNLFSINFLSILGSIVIWGIIGFIGYFILYEVINIGEEIESEIGQINRTSGRKLNNPAGPLEHTLVRLIFKLLIIIIFIREIILALSLLNRVLISSIGLKYLLIYLLVTLELIIIFIVLKLLFLKKRIFD